MAAHQYADPSNTLTLLRTRRERPRCRRGSGRGIVAAQTCTGKGPGHVRFGSKADIGEGATDVRFTPESGQSEPARVLPSAQQLRQLGDIAGDPPRLV